MIIIGEKLNSSIPSTLRALETCDEAAILGLIAAQKAAGADFLDINTAICGEAELAKMLWVISLAKRSGCGLMLDTTNPAVLREAAGAAAGCPLILNSTTLDDRFDTVVPLALAAGAAVVALPIDSGGMPHTLAEKCAKMDTLVEKLRAVGMPDERIFLDVLAETLATDGGSAQTALSAIRHAAQTYPAVRTTCGLSNVSFGLPKRGWINSAFCAAAVAAGLSSAILDPMAMAQTLAAARVVAGQDDYCMEYITYTRSL